MASKIMPELTDPEQKDGSSTPSSPVSGHTPALSFPQLTPDGSVECLQQSHAAHHSLSSRSHGTPPAALSSLGAKASMASPHPLAGSEASLLDAQYDMLDDVSEFSSEGHETASLTSTPQASDDEDDTMPLKSSSTVNVVLEHQGSPRRSPRSSQLAEGVNLGDSLGSDDLETPRQSVLNPICEPQDGKTRPAPSPDTALAPEDASPLLEAFVRLNLLEMAQFCFMVLMILSFVSSLFDPSGPSILDRRSALSHAAAAHMNDTEISSQLNLEHLIPLPDQLGGETSFQRVHHQGVSPNYIIISLLQGPAQNQPPYPQATKVYRLDADELAFNLTKLIDGVYLVNISLADAYDIVWVDMEVDNPSMHATAWHNFGDRKFAYEQPWLDMLAGSVNAGLKATKNVTTELATYMQRDLQVFRSSAVSMLLKAARQADDTVDNLKKDFVLVRQDVVVWTEKVQKSVSTAVASIKELMPSKTSLAKSLARSRTRAHNLRVLLQQEQAAENEAARMAAANAANVANLEREAKKIREEASVRLEELRTNAARELDLMNEALSQATSALWTAKEGYASTRHASSMDSHKQPPRRVKGVRKLSKPQATAAGPQ